MIERLESAKVMLHEESLSSIATDGIVLLAHLLTSYSSCLHGRATARARGGSGGSASYKVIKKKNLGG
jgi:hypothetical protein